MLFASSRFSQALKICTLRLSRTPLARDEIVAEAGSGADVEGGGEPAFGDHIRRQRLPGQHDALPGHDGIEAE